MRIAIIGYGKMGQMVEKAALARGHEVVAKLDSANWTKADLQNAEICIEFTNPHSVIENIRRVSELKLPIVIGTTGWYDMLDAVKSLIEKNQSAALYGPNYSIGVNIWLQIVAKASQLINIFDDYEIAGIEEHHSQKLDSPSGTALEMARVVENEIDRLKKLSISSVRCGSIPGTHTLLFDSCCDQITITHMARNREGFAKGAITAAEWLSNKKGLYTFNDCMQEIIQGQI